MNYDFAQVIDFGGVQVMIRFTVLGEYKSGNKNLKTLNGLDDEGYQYAALGKNGFNYKTDAINVKKVGRIATPSVPEPPEGVVDFSSFDFSSLDFSIE